MNAVFDLRTLASDAVARAAAPPDRRRPLTRDLPPSIPFPLDALGPLRSVAEAIHDATKAPLAIGAQSVLAAATLAVQQHRDVELPGAGRKPLTGLYATIAESGERKSACDAIALRPVRKFEESLRREHAPALASYVADAAAWKAATEAATKRGKGDRHAIRAALETIGGAPKPPPHPMLLVSDPTPEALVQHLRDGRPWAGLFTDEGGALIGGHAMNDDNRLKTGALLNTLWDGSPIRVLRVGSGKTFLPGRRCSAHVMMQNTVAAKFFGDATLGGIGTLARVLTVAPDTAAGTRLYRDTSFAASVHIGDYCARIDALLSRPPCTVPDEADVLDPPALTLDAAARTKWIAFHDDAERAIAPSGLLAPIRAFGSKLAEHAGRLAAVLSTYADPETMSFSAANMECGIALAQHYAAELLRLGEASQVAPDLQLAQRLLAWWQARPNGRCHLAEIYQCGPYAVRDAATAKRIVAILEEHGWIERLPAGTMFDGASKRDAWELLME